MLVNITSLEPKIRKVLSAPGTDLSTISAKRVRKQLLELDSSLTADWLKDNKGDVDGLIARIYEEISTGAGAGSGDGDDELSKRKRHSDEDEADESAPSPPPKKSKNKATEKSDEKLARELQQELNGHQRSSRSGVKGGKANGAKRGGKRGKKSAETINSDGEVRDGGDEEAKPKRRGGGFQKEYVLSEPLAALLQVEKMSRPQVVKHLWLHIKAQSLQNPSNGQEIICDDKFRAIFGVEKINMFKMSKELGSHLSTP